MLCALFVEVTKYSRFFHRNMKLENFRTGKPNVAYKIEMIIVPYVTRIRHM